MGPIKAATAVALTALAAALAVPLLTAPRPTAGKPDDVAELLPGDSLAFVEIVKAPLVLNDWKEYVGAFCRPEGRDKVADALRKAVDEALGAVPEKLLKDLRNGLPSLQRLAVAFSPPGDRESEARWALVATSSDPKFFATVVEDDLRVFAREEWSRGAVKVLEIHRLGEMRFPQPLLVAAAGSRLVLTTSRPSMEEVLDRAAGKAATQDLRSNPLYAKLSAPAGDEPVVRGFMGMPWDEMGRSSGPYIYQRRSAHEMDQVDAVLGFRNIRGTTLEAVLRPGEVSAVTRIHVDSPCRIFDAFRQPAGPKTVLRYVPAGSQIVAHANLKGGPAVWKDVKDMIDRFDQVYGWGLPKERRRRTAMEEFNREMQRALGILPADIAPVVGKEAAFALVNPDAFQSEGQMLQSLLFVVDVADAEQAKVLLERLKPHRSAYRTEEEEGVRYYIPGKEFDAPVFGLHGTVCLIGAKVDALKLAVKTAGEGSGLKPPAGSDAASKFVMVRHRAVWELLRQGFGADLPDIEKDLDLDGAATFLISEDDAGVRLASEGAGLGLVWHGGTVMTPGMFLFGRALHVMPPGVSAATTTPAPPVEAPKLEPDELARRVKRHVRALRSDDVVARDEAIGALKALGPQAGKLLAEAADKTGDVEVRERLMGILLAWRAYDLLPGLLERKAEAFIAEFRKVTAEDQRSYWNGRFVMWREEGGTQEFPYAVEPTFVNAALLDGMEHRDLLEAPSGWEALSKRLWDASLAEDVRRKLASIYAFRDCRIAGETVLSAREKCDDAHVRMYLQAALGWIPGDRAEKAVLEGLEDADVWIRRASFIAAERRRDPDVVDRLLKLLDAGDHETRWNASYTLRSLTGGAMFVNVYLDDEARQAALERARAWWEEHRATFR